MIYYLKIFIFCCCIKQTIHEIEVKKSCNHNGTVYQIGECYIKYEFCILCKCTDKLEDECKNIERCEDLDCRRDFHNQCWLPFNCKGIFR